jgi:uncharacterized OB-fold protein
MPRYARPTLEELEPRCVLSTVVPKDDALKEFLKGLARSRGMGAVAANAGRVSQPSLSVAQAREGKGLAPVEVSTTKVAVEARPVTKAPRDTPPVALVYDWWTFLLHDPRLRGF